MLKVQNWRKILIFCRTKSSSIEFHCAMWVTLSFDFCCSKSVPLCLWQEVKNFHERYDMQSIHNNVCVLQPYLCCWVVLHRQFIHVHTNYLPYLVCSVIHNHKQHQPISQLVEIISEKTAYFVYSVNMVFAKSRLTMLPDQITNFFFQKSSISLQKDLTLHLQIVIWQEKLCGNLR